jgi:hypothetical protein
VQRLIDLYTPDIFHPALSANPKFFYNHFRSQVCEALILRQQTRGQVCEVTGKIFTDNVHISPVEAKYIADNIHLATNGFWTWDLQIQLPFAGWLVIRVDEDIDGGSGKYGVMREQRLTSTKKDAAKLLVMRTARYGIEEEFESLSEAKAEIHTTWEMAQNEIEEKYLSGQERDRMLNAKCTELAGELEKIQVYQRDREALLLSAQKDEEWMTMQGIDVDDTDEEEELIKVVRAGPSGYGKVE